MRSLSKRLDGFQAVRCRADRHPGASGGNTKGTVCDSASVDPDADEPAPRTAVPYDDARADIHGLDAARTRHLALLNDVQNCKKTRLTQKSAHPAPGRAAFTGG